MCLADWTKLPPGGGARFGTVGAAACRAVSVPPSIVGVRHVERIPSRANAARCGLTADEGAFWPWQPMGGCRAWQAARPTADMTVHEGASTCAWGHEGEDWERSWHERLSPGDLPGCALMVDAAHVTITVVATGPFLDARAKAKAMRSVPWCGGGRAACGVRRGGSQGGLCGGGGGSGGSGGGEWVVVRHLRYVPRYLGTHNQ
jgi:hypothetical protein